jgi:hypothetical protein
MGMFSIKVHGRAQGNCPSVVARSGYIKIRQSPGNDVYNGTEQEAGRGVRATGSKRQV